MKLFCNSLKLVLAIGILFVTNSFSQSKDQPTVPPEAQARQGEAIFQQMCVACHSIKWDVSLLFYNHSLPKYLLDITKA